QPFHLRSFIDSLLPNFTISCLDKGNTLTTDIQENIYTSLIGDDHRLRQIFTNLLSNAMKFTENGQITIGAQIKEESDHDILLQFSVEDTGIGISEELHERIFESFSQADSTTSRSHGGTGLGLTICKKLTALLGGEIWLKSNEGKGSTFYFTARFKKGDPQLQPQNGSIRKNGIDTVSELNQLNILLVEDNQFNRDLAEIVLEQKGHKVHSAVNGLEALEALTNESFDLILMDVQMPEMDGLEATSLIRLCEESRANEASAHMELLLKLQDKVAGVHVPIIAMTALAGDRERFIAAGMDDYVAKPFQPDQLLKAFAETVKQKG
ncbi:MAG: ATP-binding protein, partial [Desulfobulbaceae bacterium]|nr:ATP-binding protein [Desulfobulbaceae bacterium]